MTWTVPPQGHPLEVAYQIWLGQCRLKDTCLRWPMKYNLDSAASKIPPWGGISNMTWTVPPQGHPFEAAYQIRLGQCRLKDTPLRRHIIYDLDRAASRPPLWGGISNMTWTLPPQRQPPLEGAYQIIWRLQDTPLRWPIKYDLDRAASRTLLWGGISNMIWTVPPQGHPLEAAYHIWLGQGRLKATPWGGISYMTWTMPPPWHPFEAAYQIWLGQCRLKDTCLRRHIKYDLDSAASRTPAWGGISYMTWTEPPQGHPFEAAYRIRLGTWTVPPQRHPLEAAYQIWLGQCRLKDTPLRRHIKYDLDMAASRTPLWGGIPNMTWTMPPQGPPFEVAYQIRLGHGRLKDTPSRRHIMDDLDSAASRTPVWGSISNMTWTLPPQRHPFVAAYHIWLGTLPPQGHHSEAAYSSITVAVQPQGTL